MGQTAQDEHRPGEGLEKHEELSTLLSVRVRVISYGKIFNYN